MRKATGQDTSGGNSKENRLIDALRPVKKLTVTMENEIQQEVKKTRISGSINMGRLTEQWS